MADNSLNQVVLTALQQVSGSGRAGSSTTGVIPDLLPVSAETFSSAVTDASRQINTLTSANQALIESVLANTQAVIQNSASQTGGRSAGSTIGSIASSVFGSGLGLAPLVSSLVNLFGGGRSEPPPSLLRYVAPPSLQLDLGNTPGTSAGLANFSPVTYGQNGLPKLAPQDRAQGSTAQSSQPQISIQVNALDSRSFMDHSHEIAQAVRQAMLNSSSLNDVVSDL
jgi:hypothetical protein